MSRISIPGYGDLGGLRRRDLTPCEDSFVQDYVDSCVNSFLSETERIASLLKRNVTEEIYRDMVIPSQVAKNLRLSIDAIKYVSSVVPEYLGFTVFESLRYFVTDKNFIDPQEREVYLLLFLISPTTHKSEIAIAEPNGKRRIFEYGGVDGQYIYPLPQFAKYVLLPRIQFRFYCKDKVKIFGLHWGENWEKGNELIHDLVG